MCGRYGIVDERDLVEMRQILEEINERYKEIQIQNRPAAKLGEIFPTDIAPVLALERGEIHAGLMKWGFPQWQGSGVIINARSETAHEKPMFAKSLETRRCIVPSTGFYEWTHPKAGPKDKYLIRHADKAMLYMAGLYSRYKDEKGQVYVAYVILTAPANHSIAVLHDRMPIILGDSEQREAWLRDSGAAVELLRARNEEEFALMAV